MKQPLQNFVMGWGECRSTPFFVERVIFLKKRLLSLFLAVVLAVSCAGYRPPKAYASPVVITVEALEMLYALLLSMGIVVSASAAHDAKMDATEIFFNSMNSAGQGAVGALFSTMKVTGEGLYIATDGFDRATLVKLWDAVFSAKASQISYAPPIAGLQSYSFPSDGSGDFYENGIFLGSCVDSPFFIKTNSEGNSFVTALLPEGFFLRYEYSILTGSVSDVYLVPCPLDTQLKLMVKYREENRLFYSIVGYPTFEGNHGVTGGAFYNDDSYGGMAWGNSVAGYYAGTVYGGAMTYMGGVSIYDEGLIDCDTWADSMSNVDEVKKEVGIYTGKDLTDYNTSESAYEDLITGVQNPALNPDIPVTPDLTGIAGALKGILDWLKALPATLANTFLGKAELDFDALKNNGFTTKFPFSIPFDLYNCIAQLVASPVPPVFTLSFAGTVMESAGDIVIDMSQFEVLAKIVRFFVFFGFVLGLIKLTRYLIKG